MNGTKANETTLAEDIAVSEKLIPPEQESNNENVNNEIESQKPLRPPPMDGGWGWMCVVGLFIHCFILVGTGRSFTIVYVELIDRYNKSAVATSVIASIRGTSRGFFCESYYFL